MVGVVFPLVSKWVCTASSGQCVLRGCDVGHFQTETLNLCCKTFHRVWQCSAWWLLCQPSSLSKETWPKAPRGGAISCYKLLSFGDGYYYSAGLADLFCKSFADHIGSWFFSFSFFMTLKIVKTILSSGYPKTDPRQDCPKGCSLPSPAIMWPGVFWLIQKTGNRIHVVL